MAADRKFDLGDILTVTTGCLVSLRHMDGIYDILNFMAGESVSTHQIPRVLKEAGPVLLFQHPQLSAVSAEGVNKNNLRQWLHEQKQEFGDALLVTPMGADEHERIDPMSELVEKIHPDKIIVV